MESLVVTANSKSELEILQAVARKLGMTTFELSERDKRLFARRKMNELAGKTSKVDISEEEIMQMIEDARNESRLETPLIYTTGAYLRPLRTLSDERAGDFVWQVAEFDGDTFVNGEIIFPVELAATEVKLLGKE